MPLQDIDAVHGSEGAGPPADHVVVARVAVVAEHGPRRGVQDGDVAGSLTVAGQAEESICDVQGLDTRVRADRV
ncbi:MAG: hypothetical protein JWO67_4641, partial [Streptosporangiaceae bacterium]|nr:hypothetical protein [Streptosporangiaceae bacterium]